MSRARRPSPPLVLGVGIVAVATFLVATTATQISVVASLDELV